jgi:hypothetical protein
MRLADLDPILRELGRERQDQYIRRDDIIDRQVNYQH